MAKIHDTIAAIRHYNPKWADTIEEWAREQNSRRNFGLVYETHSPEVFENPTVKVKRGDRVRIKNYDETDENTIWQVVSMNKKNGTAQLVSEHSGDEFPEDAEADIDKLVHVTSQDKPVYPGLKLDEDGEVSRSHEGDEDPGFSHAVINGENYDVLRTLSFTHLGKIDAIYIDPPYNTGNKDWKYNNDYVDGSDEFRSSSFLNFLERRLLLAKKLLNPEDSVLILTIDEKEFLRVGQLLEQTFPEAHIQMITIKNNPAGTPRKNQFYRTNEFIFFVQLGKSSILPLVLDGAWRTGGDKSDKNTITWKTLRRTGSNNTRTHSPGCFYPIYIDDDGQIVKIGDALPRDVDRSTVKKHKGIEPTFPMLSNGIEGCWQQTPENLKKLVDKGYVKVNINNDKVTIYFLIKSQIKKVESGVFPIVGRESINNTIKTGKSESGVAFIPGTQWDVPSHNANAGGTSIINKLLGEKRFDYPKSLYAVEDALRFFVKDKPHATILDFFGGSGTTMHAVMRLNTQDGGKRKCIVATNNEVSVEEHNKFMKQGLHPGDDEWEKYGVCQYATKPRIKAAITGKTALSDFTEDIKGDYKYNDKFPMSDGLNQNAKFFTLSYPSISSVEYGYADNQLLPIMWLAGGMDGDIVTKEQLSNNPIMKCGTCLIVHTKSSENIIDINDINDMLNEHDEITHVYVVGDEQLTHHIAQQISHNVIVDPLWSAYTDRMNSQILGQ